MLAHDAKLRDQLRSQGGFLCVNTAAADLAPAADASAYLVVRGICDFCEAKASDKWQRFAAAQAASFVAQLLTALPSEAKSAKAATEAIMESELGLAELLKAPSA